MKSIKKITKSAKDTKKDLKQKLNMFDRMPDNCLACNKDFDKKDKQQVQTWFVVVKNETQTVNLYCPECWNKATKLVQDFLEKKNDTDSTNV